jgi:hypothetical protein
MTELKQFLGGYFHQDWESEASDPDAVISQFLECGPNANEIDCIVSQILCYLEDGKGEAEVERGLLEDLGCYYYPGADGLSARGWLRHVAERLSAGRDIRSGD